MGKCFCTDWLTNRREDADFELKPADVLAALLRRFYAEARTLKGLPYSRPAMISIRSAIQRHLIQPPFNRTISIISDREFKPANLVFTGRLKVNREEGNDTTKHKDVIEPGDIARLYDTDTLSNLSPQALQNKVFFEISLHFARRAKEGMRDLKKSSFAILTDDQGKRYATITHNEKSKKDKGEKKQFTEKEQRMYAKPGDSRCPVNSLELYLSKLHPDKEEFFQQVSRTATSSCPTWYNGRPIGSNTIATFMSRISKAAKLSKVYTNHCIRVTAVTVLSNAGVGETDIISVSGHKNVQSLVPYQRKVGDEKRRNISHTLAAYGGQTSAATSYVGNSLPALPNERTVYNAEMSTTTHQLQGLLQGNHFHAEHQHIYFNVTIKKD